jgi:NIMA (never in mitosis gene a)-related kinase
MCLLKPPFDAQSLPALALKIAKGEFSPVPKVYSKELRKLAHDMLQV